jgi:hypothetical protein
MKKTVIYDHDLGDKVTITELKRPGRVAGLNCDGSGNTYCVKYWDNGCRKTAWVSADDIEPQKPITPISIKQ